MPARHFGNILRQQLGRRAVSSLEYAMVALLVVVASLGAVNSIGANHAPSAPAASSQP